MTIGESIKMHRKEMGMTQKEFGDEIKCSASQVSKWEMGDETPKWEMIKEMHYCFGESIIMDALED